MKNTNFWTQFGIGDGAASHCFCAKRSSTPVPPLNVDTSPCRFSRYVLVLSPVPPFKVEFEALPGGAAGTLQHFSTLNGGTGDQTRSALPRMALQGGDLSMSANIEWGYGGQERIKISFFTHPRVAILQKVIQNATEFSHFHIYLLFPKSPFQ